MEHDDDPTDCFQKQMGLVRLDLDFFFGRGNVDRRVLIGEAVVGWVLEIYILFETI